MRMRLGHFDPIGPLDKIPTSDICSKYAIDLARDGVAQSVALLKNDGPILPLSSPASVAVIGPNADLSESIAVSTISIIIFFHHVSFLLRATTAPTASVTTNFGTS